MDTTQLLKGVLEVAVLAVIGQEDGYGYDIVRRLRESRPRGCGRHVRLRHAAPAVPGRSVDVVRGGVGTRARTASLRRSTPTAGARARRVPTKTWAAFADTLDDLLGLDRKDVA